MLRDDLKEEQDYEFDDETTQYGTCRFCKQIKAIHPLFPWDQETLDECASEICGCTGSQIYAARKKRVEKAAKLIEQKFGHSIDDDDYNMEYCAGVCEILNNIAKAVSEEKIGKTTIRITGKVKCDISLSKQGKIKIERTITHKDTDET